MYLSTVVNKSNSANPKSPTLAAAPQLMKVVKDGLGIAEGAIVFSVSPLSCPANDPEAGVVPANGNGSNRVFRTQGDVFIVKAACLDLSLWKIGGAAVPLRLLQVANVRENTELVFPVFYYW
jgi:hypothetical protein